MNFSHACIILILLLLLAAAGCSTAGSPPTGIRPSPVITTRPLPSPTMTPLVTTSPAPTTILTTIPATQYSATPSPTPTRISEAALKARLVDARNKLTNMIDSEVADTVLIHRADGCEIKKTKELGYLVDAVTGESTFVKGDYWSIDADLFTQSMGKEHEYVIIHTHPRMWATCRGEGVVSQYTFSDGDLIATHNLTAQGYHIRTLIAISDKEYRIWPKVADGWKSEREIRQAVTRIEQHQKTSYSYYDSLLDMKYYDVDSLMPLLAKELGYSYTANQMVLA